VKPKIEIELAHVLESGVKLAETRYKNDVVASIKLENTTTKMIKEKYQKTIEK
jgi:hypothetical protein